MCDEKPNLPFDAVTLMVMPHASESTINCVFFWFSSFAKTTILFHSKKKLKFNSRYAANDSNKQNFVIFQHSSSLGKIHWN